jgi:transcriptional regulator of acetoin/glycerol metabolism
LGGETPIPVDLHVICASHRNILEMVASGEFREDLYYRLNGIAFELPPLRNRSDIAQMIHDLLIIEAETMSEKLTIDDSAMQILLEFSWPGNIRQLRNVLRYAMAVCDNRIITCNDLPVDVAGSLKPSRQAMASPIARKSAADPFENVVEAASLLATDENNPGSNAMEQAEYRVILESLQKNKWRVSSAAKDLGISRAGIYRKMRQYGIVPPNKR